MTDTDLAHLAALHAAIQAAEANITDETALTPGFEGAAAAAGEMYERAYRLKRMADQDLEMHIRRLGLLQHERTRLETEVDQLQTAALRAGNVDLAKIAEFEGQFQSDTYRHGPADAIGWPA